MSSKPQPHQIFLSFFFVFVQIKGYTGKSKLLSDVQQGQNHTAEKQSQRLKQTSNDKKIKNPHDEKSQQWKPTTLKCNFHGSQSCTNDTTGKNPKKKKKKKRKR